MRAFVVRLLMVLCLVVSASPTFAQRRGNFPDTLKTADYTLKVEVLTREVRDPWSIAFIDDKNALITEKKGPVRLWVDGKLLDQPLQNTPVVNDNGQGGMLAVGIDPEYAKTGWVYLAYSHVRGDQTRGPAMTRVVRGKIKDNAWTDQEVIFEVKPEHYRNGAVHFGTRIIFDKQGRLYFSMGDRGNQSDAQDVSKPNGKVHRINRDGTIPTDNPFAKKANAYASIISFGNRNPQGLALDPANDNLWATEHGPQGGDELNWIRPGVNYGWPIITYGKNYNGTPVGEGITEREGLEQPVHQWTPSPAMCGLVFADKKMFPKWEGNLLAGALKFQEVKRVVIKDNKYVEEEVIVKNLGRVRDVMTGPDGAIYVVLNGPDAIIRLTPQ